MQARARISSPRPRCGGRIPGSDQITVLSYTGSGGLNGDRLTGDTILCSVPIASCSTRGRSRWNASSAPRSLSFGGCEGLVAVPYLSSLVRYRNLLYASAAALSVVVAAIYIFAVSWDPQKVPRCSVAYFFRIPASVRAIPL